MIKQLCNSVLLGAFFLFFYLGITKAQPGCPNVDAGNATSVNCDNNCTTLTSTFLQTGATTSYSVTSIPYNPPYSYSSGTGIIMNIDDVWSSLLTLPFNFCFFGQVYNKIVIGSNGLISFNTPYAGGFCPWSYSASCPSSSLPLNCIFGPYHDIDPNVGGTIKYAMLGAYPCRTFVISFYQLPMYSSSCNSLKATHQIVIYETTNVIEVYMQNKPTCSSWNGGRAIVGIQNSNGSIGFAAPNRNGNQWTSSNEAWRFTPNGTSNVTIQWLQESDIIGTGASVQVCPTTTTTYTARATYANCDGSTVVVNDNVNVTFNNNLNPSVSPINPTVCSGTPVSVTASGAASYLWSNSLGTNPTVTVNPSFQTTYTVTATLGSCSTTRTVQVNVNPIPDVQASLNPAEICVGQTSQFSATGASTYSWSPSTGLSSSTGAVVNASPTTTTTYFVTGTASGCTDTASVTLVVKPNPVISVNPASPSICPGESVDLTASGASSVTWAPSNGLSSTNQLSVTSTPTNTQSYTVVGTENGCTGTTSVTVTIKSKPIMTVNPTSIQICSGDSTTLTAGGAIDYFWNPTLGLFPSNVAQVQAFPTETTTYTITGTTNGCTDSIHSTVIVISNPSVNISPDSISICPGETATLTASGGINYTWSPTTWLNSVNSPTVQSTPTESIIYTVIGTTDGCNGTAQAVVVVKQKPILNVQPSVATICENANVDLTASGADSYQWSPQTGLSSSTSAVVTASPQSTIQYTVIGTTNDCRDSNHVIVNINPLPIIDIQSDKTDGCEPLVINYSVMSNPTIQTCNWDLGNGQQSSSQNPSVLYPIAGQYTVSVSVTDVNGCQNSLTKTDYITTHPKPHVDFSVSPEMGIQEVESYFVSTYTQTPATWSWIWGDGLSDSYQTNSASHTYQVSNIYSITHIVETQYGCIDSIHRDYTVIFEVTIPNVFTPNNDGVNDFFVIDGIEFLPNCHLVIYNRWGRVVFESDNYKNDWDGGESAQGTYYYVFTAPISTTKPFSGSVSLFR